MNLEKTLIAVKERTIEIPIEVLTKDAVTEMEEICENLSDIDFYSKTFQI